MIIVLFLFLFFEGLACMNVMYHSSVEILKQWVHFYVLLTFMGSEVFFDC